MHSNAQIIPTNRGETFEEILFFLVFAKFNLWEISEGVLVYVWRCLHAADDAVSHLLN